MGEQIKRLLILHHYNPHNGLSSYVPEILRRLSPLYKDVVVISNSNLSDGMVGLLTPYSQQVIQRENKGFDFGGWRDAINSAGWGVLQKYDSITFMNDSCFGPLYNMQVVFEEMEASKADFWGLTLHPETKNGMPGNGRPIPEHIQSYFMTFSRDVVVSSVFQEFWQQVPDYPDVKQVIQQCETVLSRKLTIAGFTGDAYMRTRLNGIKISERAVFTEPDILVRLGNPLIKVKSFLYFDSPPCLVKMIQDNTEYNVALIEDHFSNVFNPNVSVNIVNKSFLPAKKSIGNARPQPTAAMHFHVFYLDIFEKHILKLFNNNTANVDLFITTDTTEKKLHIEKYANDHGFEKRIKQIILVGNRGRDVSAWLKIAGMMGTYDVAGHFHTKKSPLNRQWMGESWMDEIAETLILHTDEIIRLFMSNQRIGIVIPDIPLFFKNTYGINYWGKTKNKFDRLWNEMTLEKRIQTKDIISPIMAYGNMYWYRPKAIEPLTDLHIHLDDFPPEPLPSDGTLSHAFERLPVYVAWAKGYDFRVLLNPDFPFSGFNYKLLVRTIQEKHDILASPTWRAGRFVSYLPGKLFRLLQRLFVGVPE